MTWISIDERLPELREEVLAFLPPDEDSPDGYWGRAFRVENGWEMWWQDEYEWSNVGNEVTHWMPIVAPERQ